MAIPVIAARIGWLVLGSALTVGVKSAIVKEGYKLFKQGVEALTEDYKRDIEKNKQTVKDTKAGKP